MRSLKRLTVALTCLALAFAGAGPAFSQSFPVNNPTYTPTSIVSQTLSAPGTAVAVTQSDGTGSLRVTGTCTSLAGVVQASNDSGGNWSAIPIMPVGSGVSGAVTSGAIGGTGFWRFSASGYNRVRVNVTALSASCTFAFAGTDSALVDQLHGDPCGLPAIAKSSAVVNISSATTTALVAAVAGKTTYVCGFTASMLGTTPSIQFKTGTQVTNPCDTGAASLTGTFAPTSGAILALPVGPATIFQSASAGQLCATSGGTGPSIQGVLTYVQQ